MNEIMPKKLLPLCILRILEKNTDSDHRMLQKDLQSRLQEEYGIRCDRKTVQQNILYLKEFLFPRLGPIETHLFFIVLCIGSMVLGTSDIININGFGLKFADVVFIVGGIPMYYEMIRLQIQLFKRLSKKDEEERKSK